MFIIFDVVFVGVCFGSLFDLCILLYLLYVCRVVFDSIRFVMDVRMHVIVSLSHGCSNVRYCVSIFCVMSLISFNKSYQINTKTFDRFDFYEGQATLHGLNETICGFLRVPSQTY